MKRNQRFRKWLAVPFLSIATVWSGQVYAATVASVQTGDWNNTATWDCGCVPGAGDTITISTGTTVRVDTTRHTGNLTVNGTLDTHNQFLEFEGTTFTNHGSIISSTSTDGEIDFNGVGAAPAPRRRSQERALTPAASPFRSRSTSSTLPPSRLPAEPL